MKLLLLIVLASPLVCQARISLTPPWPGPYWDIPGSYCKDNYPAMQCCPGRQDRCSVPILGTLCYCDTFCNRTTNSDCCPDYFTHCEGLSKGNYYYQEGQAPSTLLRPPEDCLHGVLNISNPVCLYKGREVAARETVQDNCNLCECQVSRLKPGCMEVMCSTNKCMLDEELIREMEEGVDKGLYTWSPSNYSEFWGKSLEEGRLGKLGAEQANIPGRYMSAVHLSYSPSNLPLQFSTRSSWQGLVSDVSDQGWCASSWAVASAAVAGDRASIVFKSSMDLSSDALTKCGEVCKEGQVSEAWNYIRRHGLWETKCKVDGKACVAQEAKHCTRFRSKPAYRVGREGTIAQPARKVEDIMQELMTQGPLVAIIRVYSDLFMYSKGVYTKTNLAAAKEVGHHAVRIVGWGEEDGLRYWEVANSWGKYWGEEGFFKIKRGSNECEIEEYVVGAWPRKIRRRARRRKTRRNRRVARTGAHGQ